jgi:hypothetical protein
MNRLYSFTPSQDVLPVESELNLPLEFAFRILSIDARRSGGAQNEANPSVIGKPATSNSGTRNGYYLGSARH